jgi:WD40 repeat protein
MANRSTWKDVHLFVSSTFRDTQAERDVLVRRVFPVLRAELLQHKVRLIDIDLRWGIEGQDESGVVGICMDVLNKALPRFIGIIGDRYGWIPSVSEVSVTEQEIMAALNHSGCRPLFLLRNPARPEGSETLDFLDDSDSGANAPDKAFQLNRLRKHIEETSTARVYRYRCSINEGKVKPDAAFETQALEGLRESLRSLYTTDDVMMDAAPSDTVGHAISFASERAAEWLDGLRDDELTRVSDFLTSESGHIHILGAGGSGKTSLLAKAVDGILEQSINDGRVVLAAFCGAHRGTESGESVLRGMIDRLVDASIPASDDHDPSRPPTDFDELRKWFSRRIADTKAILIIDGIDQLPERDRFLSWLPNPLPDGVTVLTGSLDSESTNRLSEHWKSRASDAITLAPIKQHFGINFVTNHLARYRKSLSVDALSALMAKSGASTPLYLRIAAEELRTKGVRENLINDIAGMPGTAGGMFLWVLKRLANDQQFRWSDGHIAVGALAGCLGVARDGLSEAELVALLSTIDPKGQDPDGDTAVLLQLLRPYLGRRGDRYAPLHRVFSEALQGDGLTDADRSLLGSEHPAPLDELHEVQRAHAQLVSLFAGMPTNNLRRLSEAAWHRICSGDLDGACALLTDFSLLKSRVEAGLVRGVLEDMDTLMRAASGAPWPVPERLCVWQRLFDRRREFWEQFPEEFHQDCLNEAEGLPTTEAAKKYPIGKPWIRWVNKPEYEIRHPWEWMVRDASCAAFSPDGKSVVVGGTDGSLRLLDVETGYELWQIKVPGRRVHSAIFSPDGARLLTVSNDKTARLWDASMGSPLSVLHGHESNVVSAVFSQDGTRALTASMDKTARLWDASSGSELLVLIGHEDRVRSAVFSPDGTQMLTSSWDQTARLWDVATGEELSVLRSQLDSGQPRSAVFSSDGTKIFIGYGRRGLVCDAVTGDQIGLDGVPRDAVFSPDGESVLSAFLDKAGLWDAVTGTFLRGLIGHEGRVNSAVFSLDGTKVLTSSDDSTARVWDATTGTEMYVLHVRIPTVTSALFSPDGMLVITISLGTLSCWDLKSKAECSEFNGHTQYVQKAVFSPDGTRLLTAAHDETVQLWDVATWSCCLIVRGYVYSGQNSIFSPDSKQLTMASLDNTVCVWDTDSCTKYIILEHWGRIHSALFSRDGTKVLTMSECGTVCVWDAHTGNKIRVLQRGIYQKCDFSMNRMGRVVGIRAEFSLDNTKVLTTNGGSVTCWEIATGTRLFERTNERVAIADVSPDFSKVVVGSRGNAVSLWAVETGSKVLELVLTDEETKVAKFSPDGMQVLTISGYGRVSIWDTLTGELIGNCGTDCFSVNQTDDDKTMILIIRRREILHRWSDGSPIPDSDPPVECPSRPTLLDGQGNLRHCLRIRGLSDFVPPWIHIDSPYVNDCVKVLPNDPLSFVAGCADGSVRFFRLEGVELPVIR